jgi:hypothetical protein
MSTKVKRTENILYYYIMCGLLLRYVDYVVAN